MESANGNSLSYILQLADSISERERSSTGNAEGLAAESIYKLVASDLTELLAAVITLLQGQGAERVEWVARFVHELQYNQLPLVYAMRFTGRQERGLEPILRVLQQMVSVLEKLGHSLLSFSTESELISIFQIIFSEQLFESETFCLIASGLYQTIKRTALSSWKEVRYGLFVWLFLLQHGLIASNHKRRLPSVLDASGRLSAAQGRV